MKDQGWLFGKSRQPVQVAYGVGVDSTAAIIEMIERKMPIDAIVFANIGSEKRATYDYIPIFNRYLKAKNYPQITVVKYEPKTAPYHTLEGNMVLNATLPGAALNQHTCAMKFKIEPQNRWSRNWAPAREAWQRGDKVVKIIGFEAGEEDRLKRADARAHSGKASPLEASRFEYRMILMEWGWNRQRCIERIIEAGLPVPVKSACYFCPFQQTHEVDSATPEDRARTMLIELTAEPYNTKVRGLWRKPRKRDGREGSITEYILRKKLDFVPLTDIAPLIVLNEKCQKARTGKTFESPHAGPALRQQLIDAGHAVPEVVTERNGAPRIYEESRREAPVDVETDEHMEIVESL